MNDDPFETRLRGLRRRDLAADWKAGILAAAAAPQAPLPRHVPLTPPRWLAWGLAAIWALVLALTFTTPSQPSHDDLARVRPDPSLSLQRRQELFAALLSNTPVPSFP